MRKKQDQTRLGSHSSDDISCERPSLGSSVFYCTILPLFYTRKISIDPQLVLTICYKILLFIVIGSFGIIKQLLSIGLMHLQNCQLSNGYSPRAKVLVQLSLLGLTISNKHLPSGRLLYIVIFNYVKLYNFVNVRLNIKKKKQLKQTQYRITFNIIILYI